MKYLHGAVTTSRATALKRAGDAAAKVLDEVGQVANGVAVGNGIPAASAVTLVVEPAAEDEVGGDGEEKTGERGQTLAELEREGKKKKHRADPTYMMMTQVKKPQCSDLPGPEPLSPPSSHAYLVYHVSRSTSRSSSIL